MPSERSQTLKAIHCMITFIWHSRNSKTNGTETRLVVARGWVWEIRLAIRRQHKKNFWEVMEEFCILLWVGSQNWVHCLKSYNYIHTHTQINLTVGKETFQIKKAKSNWGLEGHACNPRYLGGKIRRIMVQSQPGQIDGETLSQKQPITKKGWWSGSKCRPWVQTPVLQKKKKKKKAK
jgi:hypothetical protein